MSSTTHLYTPLRESDLPAVSRLLSHAFAGPLDGAEKWLRLAGLEHVRTLRASEAAAPGASLTRIPMGQYFGGRAVPMTGIAAVAVGPECRGRGLARELMAEGMREIAREGVPLSTLYASTQALYRQVGYEQAGSRFTIRIPIHRIDIRERAGELSPLGDGDMRDVEACYREYARRFNGSLDRGPYIWRRIRENRDEKFHGFGIPSASAGGAGGGGGGLDGYVFLSQSRKPDTGKHDVIVSDIAFTTPHAGRRLLGFLADFATMGEYAMLSGGPAHPLLMLMGQQRYTIDWRDYWMLRIISVKGALEARGYAPGVRAEVRIDVRDALLPENEGGWSLRVEDGVGRVDRAAAGGRAGAWISADVRALASMYSGHFNAEQLALIGAVEGSAEGLAAAGATFGWGGAPWMSEMF